MLLQRMAPPGSQILRHPAAHSSLVTGCSFLAQTLEGGQGAVRPLSSPGTEPWPLSARESGLWHQERGSGSLIQSCLCRNHSCPGGPHSFCPLGARLGQEQRWIWKEWQEQLGLLDWGKCELCPHVPKRPLQVCLGWRREWHVCPASEQGGRYPQLLAGGPAL